MTFVRKCLQSQGQFLHQNPVVQGNRIKAPGYSVTTISTFLAFRPFSQSNPFARAYKDFFSFLHKGKDIKLMNAKTSNTLKFPTLGDFRRAMPKCLHVVFGSEQHYGWLNAKLRSLIFISHTKIFIRAIRLSSTSKVRKCGAQGIH